MTIHVALATDIAYLPWCATTVRSLLDTTPGVSVHLFHDQPIAPADADRLATMIRSTGATATWHTVPPAVLAAFPTKGPALGGRTSWIRVVIPDLLPDLDRVIYLDADTLVLDSLEPLWNTDLAGAALGAVANVVEPAHHDHVRGLGLDPNGGYFNAGVLLMDLAAMRPSGETLTDYVTANADRLSWFDQDALNVTFAGRWLPLPPRWNAQNSLRVWGEWAASLFGPGPRDDALTAPAIVHFEGPSVVKPWHILGDHPQRARYLQTLATTPWAGQPQEGRTPLNRAIARLPRERRIPVWLFTERTRLQISATRRRLRRASTRGAHRP